MFKMRSTWTDSRLDDLNGRVSALGDQITSQSTRIDKLQHTILQIGGGLIAAFVGLMAAMLGVIAAIVATQS